MATQLLKLKKINSFPRRSVIDSFTGVNYYNKSKDLNELTSDIKIYNSTLDKIINIDTFNHNKKLRPNWKQVIVKYRNEPYIHNLDTYLQPLTSLTNEWNDKTISIVNEIWGELYKREIIQGHHPLLTGIMEEWMGTGDINRFNYKYNMDYLTKHLSQWKNNSYYNFYPLFSLLVTMKKYNIKDYSATGLILTTYRNRLVDNCNHMIDNINHQADKIKFYKDIKLSMNQGVEIGDMFTPFNFEAVYPYCKVSSWLLNNMYQVVANTVGGIEWVKKYDGKFMSLYNNDDPVVKLILDHPKITENGHSGASLYWTLSNLQEIYTKGWNKWVQELYEHL